MAVIKRGTFATLHELFVLKLCSLYDIEQELLPALAEMAKHAHDRKLKELFSTHFEETKEQRERLERALESVGEPVSSSKVEAVRGLVKDAQWLLKHAKTKESLDAGLVASALYVEHYEIAGYRSALAWANLMQHERAVRLLGDTLAEEETAAAKLEAAGKEIFARAFAQKSGHGEAK